MNEIVQYVLVGLIVLAAVVAGVRMVVRASRGRKSSLTACASCQSRDCCQRPEKNSAKNVLIKLHKSKNSSKFAPQKSRKVAWMSGLVTGLQNRVQRFESASDLKNFIANRQSDRRLAFFLLP